MRCLQSIGPTQMLAIRNAVLASSSLGRLVVRRVVVTHSLCRRFFTEYGSSSFSQHKNYRTKRAKANIYRTSSRATSLWAPDPCTPEVSYTHVSILDDISSEAKSILTIICRRGNLFDNLDHLLGDFKSRLNSKVVLEVLMNYKHLGRHGSLMFFSWAGAHLDYRFDNNVVEHMADFFGRRKLFDDMKWLLMIVFSRTGQISCRTISICIRFLGREGRVEEALCLFREMESTFNCIPDIHVFNNMLSVLCIRHASLEWIGIAFTIFQQIKSPDSYSYSNIIIGLCTSGRLEAALQVFDEMCNSGLVPTRTAVNKLIGGLCDLSKKKEWMDRVKVTDFRRPFSILVPDVFSKNYMKLAVDVFLAVWHVGLFPSTFIITHLIAELSRLRRIEEALKILNIAEGGELGSLGDCYSSVIQALCEVHRTGDACRLLSRMISLDLKAKLAVYNSVICSLCKLGDVSEAHKYFDIMMRKRCFPDNVTFTAMIHAYCRDQQWEAAYQMLMEMLSMGWCPHFHTYRMVDRLLKEQGKADLSVKLEGKLETQLLHRYCMQGQLEAAYEMLSSIFAKGIHLPVYITDAFKNAFQKAGNEELAEKLLSKLDEDIPTNSRP